MSSSRCDICGRPWLNHATDCKNFFRSSDLPSDSYRDQLRADLKHARRIIELQAQALEDWKLYRDRVVEESDQPVTQMRRLAAEESTAAAERAREGV